METKVHPYTVTNQMLADILSAAYYGGITYWAPAAWLAPGETVPDADVKRLLLPEDSLHDVYSSDYVALDRKVMVLASEMRGDDLTGLAVITEGLDAEAVALAERNDGVWIALDKKALTKGIKKAAEHFGLTVARFFDDHDATYADVAVQFALFGKIIFG